MAQLTEQLPNSNGIIPAPVLDKGPSPLAMGLGALAKGIDVFDQTRQASATRKRQAEADARQKKKDDTEALEVTAGNSIIDALVRNNAGQNFTAGDISTDDEENAASDYVDQIFNSDNMTAPQQAAQRMAKGLKRYDVAVAQGKMPRLSRQAAVDAVIQEFTNSFPNVDKVKILKGALDAAGVSSSFLDEMKAEQDDLDASRKAARDARSEAYKTGASYLGPVAISYLNEDAIVAAGFDYQSKAAVLELQTKQASLQSIRTNTEIASRTEAERQTGNELFQSGIQTMASALAPQVEAFQKALRLVGTPGADPAIEQQLKDIEVALVQNKGAVIGNIAAQIGVTAGSKGYEDFLKAADSWFETTFMQPIQSRNKAYGEASQIMKDKLGMNITAAMPFISSLQSAGIRVDAIPMLMNEFLSNPENASRLRNEINGLGNMDISSNTAKIKLAQIVSVLKGNETLNNYTNNPEQAKTIVSTLSKFSLNESASIIAGNMGNADYYLNSLGAVITATNSINQQSGFRANVNAALAITGNGKTRAALKRLMNDEQFGDEAIVMGQGMRAASAKLYSNFRRTLPVLKDSYWGAKYDTRQGRWVAVFDEAGFKSVSQNMGRTNLTAAEIMMGREPTKIGRPQIPWTISSGIGTANSLLDNLVETVDWDATSPKGTNMELRDFYTRDRRTPSMVKAEEGRANKAKESKSVLQTLVELEDQITSGDFDITVPSTIDQILDVEGTGDNPRSSADGPGQFLDSTFKKVMKETHPEISVTSDNIKDLKKKYGAEMTSYYAKQNANVLATAGVPVTAGTTYLAHFAGPQGAISVLKADPEESVEVILGRKVVEANPFLKGKTASWLVNWANGKMRK